MAKTIIATVKFTVSDVTRKILSEFRRNHWMAPIEHPRMKNDGMKKKKDDVVLNRALSSRSQQLFSK